MMNEDPTELIRRKMVEEINGRQLGREALEAQYGQVWDTQELQRDYEGFSFLAPFCGVTRKSDGKKGSLLFQHLPRFYWGFQEGP
jgi:hypothetical protein